jgi:ATP-binding protein involved in chromosome partitioning
VPLDMKIRENSDAGTPLTATEPDSVHAEVYRNIASLVAAQLNSGTNRPAPRLIFE